MPKRRQALAPESRKVVQNPETRGEPEATSTLET